MIRLRPGLDGQALRSAETSEGHDRLAAWCGWVMIAGAALTPLLGWLGPMGFALVVALAGLLCLPALRIEDADRPLAVLLLLALIWAAVSTAWSPYRPTKVGANTALKLALLLPLYWSAICAARRADPRLKRIALSVLAWGSALFGLVLLVEFATDARLYETLHFAFYEPIRHDLSEVNIGHSTFVLALVWPLAAAAAVRTGAPSWLALPMGAGVLAAAIRFGSDAPVIAVPMAALVFLAAWRWPRGTPVALAWTAAVYSLGAPAVIWAIRATGRYEAIERAIPKSWSMRMGFWGHAFDWIGDRPLRGWGLDASRMFGPGIILHPHDNALQVWLELGLAGALLAAGIWLAAVRRLARPEPDIAAAAATASASVYLLFGALNFGAWQEWWLALAALIAMLAALFRDEPAHPEST